VSWPPARWYVVQRCSEGSGCLVVAATGTTVIRGSAPVALAPMSKRISPEEVAHVAYLARLELSQDELELFTEQLGDVLEHAADVEALDLDHVEPMAHTVPLRNVVRADVVTATLDRDEVLGQAPASEGGQFRVPRILGEEP
jgi:aspartyl-tRNA(Asn)/glutamyl-tRNA(Gln) amidotransferase subunit C